MSFRQLIKDLPLPCQLPKSIFQKFLKSIQNFEHKNEVASNGFDWSKLMKTKTLEQKLAEMIPADFKEVDIIAFQLTHDGESWSVNTPFRIATGVDRAEAIARLRGRWNVFKAIYHSKARVQDIKDFSSTESECCLEVDCIAFADVRKAE